jgi:hypothetical protein
MRGWIVHKYEKYKRIWIKKCLREDIALLWSKEKAALLYRSKFYSIIQGDSYLHLALYEEEKERLIVSLGGRYTHSTVGGFPLSVEIPLGNDISIITVVCVICVCFLGCFGLVMRDRFFVVAVLFK